MILSCSGENAWDFSMTYPAYGTTLHTGGEIIHSIEDAISRLASLGVPYFASLPQFIQFLVSAGENPFTFLPALVSHIISKGGEPVQVLEELAGGFLSEGPQAYTEKQAT